MCGVRRGSSVIRDRNIICFASGWDYHPTSKHHIMRILAEHNDIIWVNWHASRRPRLSLADLRSVLGRLRQMRQGPRRVAERISVLTPWQVPLPGSSMARKVTSCFVRRAIRRVLARLPDRPVQLWSFAPDVSDLVGTFGEELVLYYCVDAFGEFPGYDRDLIERREKDLLRHSDLVVTTSPPLFESRRLLHPNVHLVQHGVDHGQLSRAVPRDLPVPAEMKHLLRPIIGFVGILGEWVDLALVADLARRRPDASFVLIGPEMDGRGPCAGLPNIHWLGGRPHQDLPRYLQCFDVALIPFKHVPLTYNANPIKLFEYLAAGLPVVCTTLPAVRPAPGSVWLADDAGRMSACCDEALACNDDGHRRRRSETMRRESWSARLEQIAELVDDRLKGRSLLDVRNQAARERASITAQSA